MDDNDYILTNPTIIPSVMESQALPAMPAFGSDVGTGNAEICLVTANSSIVNSDSVRTSLNSG